MDDVIRIDDLVVAPEVVETIVRLSAEKVEGVAAVGTPSDVSGVFSIFSQKRSETIIPAVSLDLCEGKVDVNLRLSVFFGYPFVALAEAVRDEVAMSVKSQVGIEVAHVNVFIDSLLFPKE